MKDLYTNAIQELLKRVHEAANHDGEFSSLLYQASQADLARAQLETELRENAEKLVRDAERVDRGELPSLHARIDRAAEHMVQWQERVRALRVMVMIAFGDDAAHTFLGLLEG